MAANALVLRFAADTAPARQAITQLATSGASQMAGLALAAAAAGRKIDSGLLSTVAKLALAVTGLQQAFIAFGAVSATALAIATARLAEYRKVADEAAKAGVNPTFFQQFTQAAGQSKEKIDLLAAALRNAREATTARLDGDGVAVEKLSGFAKNDRSLQPFLDRAQAAENPEQRVRAVTAAIDDLLDRGLKLTATDLAGSLFGQAAADELIARAEAAKRSLSEMIETTADKRIVSPEQIANAKELEARLAAARKEMSDGMKPILADLEVLGQALYRGWVNTEEAIGLAVKTLGGFYTLLRNSVLLLPSFQQLTLGAQTATDQAQLNNLNQQIESLKRLPINDPRLGGLQRQRDEIQGRIGAAQGRDALARDAVPFIELPQGPQLLGADDPLALAFQRERRLRERENAKGNGTEQFRGASPAGGGSRSASSEADAYEKLIAQIEKANAALKAEYETLGLSRFERERAIALAKAEAELKEKGRELTAAERADLEAKIEAQARFKEIIEQTKGQMESMKELQTFIGSNVSSFLSDIISGGKNAEQALMNLTKRLADAALQATLLGQGPLAGLFGTKGENGGVGGIIGGLFKAFSAPAGAPAAATVPSFDVGTSRVPRDMLANIHEGEMIIPKYDAELIRSGKGVGGGGNSTTIVQNMTFNGQQDPAMLRVWAAQIENNTIARIAADTARRGPVRPL